MDRTLYLSEKHGVEIRRDGPSLWIKERGKAGYRIPARLIGRVVVMGNIRMDAGVVSLFTEENIPLAFLNRQGKELAVCVPYNHHLPRHHEEQKSLFSDEAHGKLFRQWLRAARRSNQLKTLKHLAPGRGLIFSQIGFRENDYEEFLKSFLFGGEAQWVAARTTIQGLFHEMVIAALIRADLDPHLGMANKHHNFALALDLSWALAGEIDLQTLRFLAAAHHRGAAWRSRDGSVILKEGIQAIVHGFEKRRGMVHELIETLIDDLFRLIREIRMGVYEEDEGS